MRKERQTLAFSHLIEKVDDRKALLTLLERSPEASVLKNEKTNENLLHLCKHQLTFKVASDPRLENSNAIIGETDETLYKTLQIVAKTAKDQLLKTFSLKSSAKSQTPLHVALQKGNIEFSLCLLRVFTEQKGEIDTLLN